MNAAVLNLTGLIIIFIGAVLHIVSIALPNYADLDISKVPDSAESKAIEINFGVWKVCGTRDAFFEGSDCFTFGIPINGIEFDAPAWLKAVQALGIIGAIVVSAAGGMSALNLFKESRGDRLRLLPIIICGICVAGGVILLLANIIYAAKFKDMFEALAKGGPIDPKILKYMQDHTTLDWGFGLDLTASILVIVAGLLHFAVGRVGGNAHLT